jgi:hypothetical protein
MPSEISVEISSQKPSRPVAIFLGLLCMVIGAVILAGAAGVLPSSHPTTHEEAPRWVGGCIGLVFLAGGLVPISAAFALPNWFNQLVGVTVTAGLALVFNWVAFFPGERHFSMSVSLPGVSMGGVGGQLAGRAMFGLAALLGDAMVLWGLWRMLRKARAAPTAGEN